MSDTTAGDEREALVAVIMSSFADGHRRTFAERADGFADAILAAGWRRDGSVDRQRAALQAAYEKHELDPAGECGTCFSHRSETYTAYEKWPCSTAAAIAEALGVPIGDDLVRAHSRIAGLLGDPVHVPAAGHETGDQT